ncbi:MAG: lysophospholipid acyltransferase family protein [Candidatus Melainabacteria bacterium]|nr:lysophospholipid acyltransferase family protein [Candidatus Melainabacteria bacterium]
MAWLIEKQDCTRIEPAEYGWVRYFWHLTVLHTLLLFIVLRAGFRIYGREHVPAKNKAYIITSNHSSYMDSPLLGAVTWPRPIAYLAKMELFDKPLSRWLYRTLGSIAVNREKIDVSSVRSVKNLLKHTDWLLGIFPEGTRSQDGELQEAKKGVAYFAKSNQVPIVPVGISNPKLSAEKQGPYIAVVGAPIFPDNEDLDTLADHVAQSIAALKVQADAKRLALLSKKR